MNDIRHLKVVIYSNGKMVIKSRHGIDPSTMEMIHDEMAKCLNEVLKHIESEVEFKVTLETNKKPEIVSIGLLSPEEVNLISNTFKKCFNNLLSQEVGRDE